MVRISSKRATSSYFEGFITVLPISNSDCSEHHAALLNLSVVPAVADCSSKDFK